MIGRFGQINHILPVLSPVSAGTAAFNTAVVDMANAHRGTFIVHIGATDSSSGSPTITMMAATGAATTSATAIAFKYRISAAIGVDTQGAVTDATSSGVLTTKTDDGMIYLIDVDPALVASKTDGRYVYLHFTANATRSLLISAVAELEPRFIGVSPTSAT